MSDHRSVVDPLASPAEGLPPTRATGEFLKRLFDITLAGIGLIITAPVFLLIGLLIKLETPGPVFFRQERVGRGGRRFRMWKFRKMPHNMKSAGPSLTRRFDRRLTTVGRFLERTKLDELPQLINVLMGDMSIVGPRPEVPKFVVHYPDRWEVVLSVKPGIFGPNQLRHRNESELYPANCRDVEEFYVQNILPEKLEIDAQYARKHSVFGDIWLLVQCLFAVFGGTITWRTIAVRRWQFVNSLILSLAGVGTMWLAIQVSGRSIKPSTEWTLLGLAALIRPLSVLAFRIPKALATSMTADDFLRIWWCGVTSAALIAVAMIFLEQRDLSRQVLLLDATMYLGFLLMYKLVLYKSYLLVVKCEERRLARRMILASVVIGPLTTLTSLLLRRGFVVASEDDGVLLMLFSGLSAVAWPMILLLNPIIHRHSSIRFLMLEGRKIFLGAIVGMVITAYAAVIVNERDWSRTDVILPSLAYGSAMLIFGVWQNRRISEHERDGQGTSTEDRATTGFRQRLLIVGSGMHLSAYLTALTEAPDHSFEIVGIISPEPNLRTSMVGGHTVIGHLSDLPDLLEDGEISRVVVLAPGLSSEQMQEIDCLCEPYQHLLVRVDSLTHLGTVPIAV